VRCGPVRFVDLRPALVIQEFNEDALGKPPQRFRAFGKLQVEP